MSYSTRYNAGDREAVFLELMALEGDIRDQSVYFEAKGVAEAIIDRAKYNIESIQKKLEEMNFIFLHPPGVFPLTSTERMVIDIYEKQLGLLPLVWKTWFEVIGEVSLRGLHPRLCSHEGLKADISLLDEGQKYELAPISDPLVIHFNMEALEDQIETNEEVLEFEFAPDADHKADQSGGSGFSIELPNAAFDAPIHHRIWGGLYFIPYLRTCFAWGGFPGLRHNLQAAEAAREELAFLTEGLLPI